MCSRYASLRIRNGQKYKVVLILLTTAYTETQSPIHLVPQFIIQHRIASLRLLAQFGIHIELCEWMTGYSSNCFHSCVCVLCCAPHNQMPNNLLRTTILCTTHHLRSIQPSPKPSEWSWTNNEQWNVRSECGDALFTRGASYTKMRDWNTHRRPSYNSIIPSAPTFHPTHFVLRWYLDWVRFVRYAKLRSCRHWKDYWQRYSQFTYKLFKCCNNFPHIPCHTMAMLSYPYSHCHNLNVYICTTANRIESVWCSVLGDAVMYNDDDDDDNQDRCRRFYNRRLHT